MDLTTERIAGTMTYMKELKNMTQIKTCTSEWCTKPGSKVYARGLCHNCYEKNRRGTLGPPKEPSLCAGPECDREVHCKGYCLTHYMQAWLGQEVKPIRRYREHREVVEVIDNKEVTISLRQCKNCAEWKDAEQHFYKHGKRDDCYQSECKPCMGERTRRNRLQRERKLNAE